MYEWVDGEMKDRLGSQGIRLLLIPQGTRFVLFCLVASFTLSTFLYPALLKLICRKNLQDAELSLFCDYKNRLRVSR